MKIKKICRNIYPKLDLEDLDEIKEKLVKKFGIEIYFLFEDGIEFHYPDNLNIKCWPGDISFFEGEKLKLYMDEYFTSLKFFLPNDSLYLEIKMEDSLSDDFLNMLGDRMKEVTLDEEDEEEEDYV